jgi:hypothetical protein
MSEVASESATSAAAPARAVDLDALERRMRTSGGTDLTEAKEAIVDALLGLALNRCTGSGLDGAVIYGMRPSSRFVSGFLLPRFDETGLEDETSDIRIATMGVDFQLSTEGSGDIVVRPEAAIYVRELPTWDEIIDPRHEMMPQVQLSRQTRQEVERRARDYIAVAIGALPQFEDEESDERPGDATAEAEQARETADAAEDASADQGSVDVEARGVARATAQAAQRAEAVAQGRRDLQERRTATRRERISAIATIRREAFDRAFAELGIRLMEPGQDGAAVRLVASTDLLDDVDDVTAPDNNEPAAEALEVPEETAEEGPQPAAGAIGTLRPGGGRIDDNHAAPQPIPQKWRRIHLSLGEFSFDPSDEASIEAASGAFSARLTSSLTEVLSAWLATQDGQDNAYRPGERIFPSHFATRESWDAYLSALRARRPVSEVDVRPDLNGVALVIDADADFVDTSRLNLRVALENGAGLPSGQDAYAFEHSLFQVSLAIAIPASRHRALRLDRVEPSYRFRDWLEYPAMGLNCGVERVAAADDVVAVRTSWAPRYAQPRIDPRVIEGVPTRYAELASAGTDISRLLALPDAYDAWINDQAGVAVDSSLGGETADEERRTRERDLEAYRRESRYIRIGVELLRRSKVASESLTDVSASGERRASLERLAIPWRAWLLTNEAFAEYGRDRYTDWRLFQLAFILAHLPTLASRMPEFEDQFDPFRDELSASLLYFATGGGKSEAFFGLLIFNLFLDRMRGKHRGVTALVRYPLRLLTLQQARRLMRVLVHAELVRLRHGLAGWPFEVGFWVGSGNTPNRVAQGFGGVPSIAVAAHRNDTELLNPPSGSSEAAVAARRRSTRYREALEAYDKLQTCPCCGTTTGMRKYPGQFGRIGIVCFNDACEWNRQNPPEPHRVPLPFLLTDDTIYQRAPSVVLGTVDKLALIGQHDRTINAIVGMLGCARRMDPQSRHLFVPRGERALAKADDEGMSRVRPAYAGAAEVFQDPFPSLVIQDEGHLLDESLGTFSGLFETTLERILLRLGSGILRDSVATWPSGKRRPRLAKVIAATATISDPDRQLRVLYQRDPLRFPCPGPDLYHSFYAAPREPRPPARRTYAATLPERTRPEFSAPRMRVYVSVMTNGRSHTMTTSAVVSAYHLTMTRLWRAAVEEGRPIDAIEEMIAALPAEDPLTPLRAQALRDLAPSSGSGADLLATLLDLHRISLTYVTNKKGGDQIIETLQSQVERDQRAEGIADLPFDTDLISGGVTIAEIQDVMGRAEGSTAAGAPFPELGKALRNIVATSAISHGVDVDKFNAMFFAGLPADIAEYIQASSRIGRTHVGFSILVPTPHSRRDRYVVETHDQFHRFLERMIPPPAVQRWADRAIRRMIPSILQAYLCAVVEQEDFVAAPANNKGGARHFTTAAAVKAWADRHPSGGYPAAVRAVADFALDAIGLDGRGEDHIGAATHAVHYRRFVGDRVLELLNVFTLRSDGSRLSNFWQSIQTREIRKPMTSLRDVDAGGVIQGAWRDPFRGRNVNLETVRQVMRVIRGQRMAVRADVDADPAPIDVED